MEKKEKYPLKNQSIKRIWRFVAKITKIFFYIIGSWLPVKGIAVFCYHSIGDGRYPIALPLGKFRKQMEYLKRKGFGVMTSREFIDCIKSNKIPKQKSVLITFDDGFKDNFTNAFPLLSKLRFPFIIFLTTDFIGKRAEWFNEYAYSHLHANRNTTKHNITRENMETIRSSEFVRKNMGFLLNYSDEKLKELIYSLNEVASQQICQWDDVKEMSEQGVSFGSHSCKHWFLSDLSTEDLIQEVKNSKVKIEKMIGKEVKLFAYPFGNYSKKVKKVLSQQGYEAAFSAVQAPCDNYFDRYAINRILIHKDISFREFKFYLCRGFNWYSWMRNILKS